MKPQPKSIATQDIQYFEQKLDWEAWLNENHDSSPGIWLQLAKKGADVPSVSYDEAVEVALCYGWI